MSQETTSNMTRKQGTSRGTETKVKNYKAQKTKSLAVPKAIFFITRYLYLSVLLLPGSKRYWYAIYDRRIVCSLCLLDHFEDYE